MNQEKNASFIVISLTIVLSLYVGIMLGYHYKRSEDKKYVLYVLSTYKDAKDREVLLNLYFDSNIDITDKKNYSNDYKIESTINYNEPDILK